MILSQSLARLERTCYIDKSTARFKFGAIHWLIASVTFAFLTVIAFDTFFSYIPDHSLQSQRHRGLFSKDYRQKNMPATT